jgi:16S rRNA (uracil1498-N3)-methyltransferase
LAQALIKPERFEWVVQKATELGVDRVMPVVTARTVVRLGPDQAKHKVARWQRIAREAAKQCGRAKVLRIDTAQPFDQFAPALARYPGVLMPTLLVRAIPLKEGLESIKEMASVMALIGPEGDFTRDEVALAQRYGARPVSLGHLTLRSETAAIAMLAILQHTLGTRGS